MSRAMSLGMSPLAPTPGPAETRHPEGAQAIIERISVGHFVAHQPPEGHPVQGPAPPPAHVDALRSEGFVVRIWLIRATSCSKSGCEGCELIGLLGVAGAAGGGWGAAVGAAAAARPGSFRSSSASIIATRFRCRSTVQSVDRK